MGHTSPQSIKDTSGHTFAISKEKAQEMVGGGQIYWNHHTSQKQLIFEKLLDNLELEGHTSHVGGCAACSKKFVVTVQYPFFDTACPRYLIQIWISHSHQAPKELYPSIMLCFISDWLKGTILSKSILVIYATINSRLDRNSAFYLNMKQSDLQRLITVNKSYQFLH